MPSRRSPIRKVFRYFYPLALTDPQRAMESMAAHWSGFSWRSGPVVVRWTSDDYPELQVWAATLAEGKRVIRHALAHAQVSEQSGEWLSSVVSGKRCGSVAVVRASSVSARPGGGGIVPRLLLP